MFDYIAAFERLIPPNRSKLSFQPERCLYSINRFTACTACFELCPVDAIQPGKPPILDAQRCVNCLACSAVCPVGAYSAQDPLPDLLESAARLETGVLELLCTPHPLAELGLPDTAAGAISGETAAVRVKGCLAGLGSGAYLALAGLGLTQVAVRKDACAECAWSELGQQVDRQVSQAQRILDIWQRTDFLTTIDHKANLVERPLTDAGAPPISRRDLFHFVTQQGKSAAVRLVTKEPASQKGKISRDRQRILSSVTSLLAQPPQQDPLLTGSGFALVAVSDACTACGVCARTCPTGALRFINEQDLRYQLLFLPRTCIDCQACVAICLPKAITLDESPSFSQVFEVQGLRMLSQGDLRRCTLCSRMFTPKSEETLCPPCDLKKKNPIARLLPPGMGNLAQ